MSSLDESIQGKFDKLTELSKNSLVRINYSCCGNNSSIDEGEFIPIVPEKKMQLNELNYTLADKDDMLSIVQLLQQYSLPTTDLQVGKRIFIVAKYAEQLVACVSVEKYGDAGLLRSLAVHTEWKEIGLGKIMVQRGEDWSAENGVKTLYLLTTTASGFFQNMAWEVFDRDKAPVTIAATTEFSTTCPSTAQCLKKTIG